MPVSRILMVEDHLLFGRVIRSILEERTDFLITCEASDGLEAIRRAEELQPDLVLLDIGLPKLNGLEAARHIRRVAPKARFVFVSQESSPDVIRETFHVGGQAYVQKARAQRDLVLAIDVVLLGKRFVSGGLKPDATIESAVPQHEILFCSGDAALVDGLCDFVVAALRADKAAITVVTEPHQQSLHERLRARGVDVDAALQRGAYVPVGIRDLLSMFMVDGSPDGDRFSAAAEYLIRTAGKGQTGIRRGVVACGECAPTLWAEDNVEGAIRLEHFLDKLATSHQIDILCAYPSLGGHEDGHALKSLCAEHTTVCSV